MLEKRLKDPAQIDGCPECGSARLNWRVKRTSGVQRAEVYLVWSCRDCETTWLESITPDTELPS